MIYRTNSSFREAIEARIGEEIPLSLWESIVFIIWGHQIACHEPFDEEDLRMAVPRVEDILRLRGEL